MGVKGAAIGLVRKGGVQEEEHLRAVTGCRGQAERPLGSRAWLRSTARAVALPPWLELRLKKAQTLKREESDTKGLDLGRLLKAH